MDQVDSQPAAVFDPLYMIYSPTQVEMLQQNLSGLAINVIVVEDRSAGGDRILVRICWWRESMASSSSPKCTTILSISESTNKSFWYIVLVLAISESLSSRKPWCSGKKIRVEGIAVRNLSHEDHYFRVVFLTPNLYVFGTSPIYVTSVPVVSYHEPCVVV